MALNVLKRDIAGPGDSADFQASLERYSLTDRAPVVVANMSEANQLAATLDTEGLVEGFPLFVYVRDLQRHLCKPAPNEGWIILGGRLHGAIANIRRFVPDQAITELHVSGSGFVKASVGFTRAANGGVLIPETGLYRIRFYATVDGIYNTTPGIRYLALRINGNRVPGNVEFEGTTGTKLYDELELQQGDSLMPMAYQATGQQRDVTGTLGVWQSLAPSW